MFDKDQVWREEGKIINREKNKNQNENVIVKHKCFEVWFPDLSQNISGCKDRNVGDVNAAAWRIMWVMSTPQPVA